MSEQQVDVWAAGDGYERYMGRWSRLVAARFVSWLGCEAGLRWLDVGCGSGALTQAVADRCHPRTLLGLEPSPGFVATARASVSAPARFARADAQSLPVPDAVFDVAVSGLVLNFLPDPGSAVAEAARAVRPGGLVAAYVWDYAGGMELLRRFWDAAVAVDPSAGTLDEGGRFPLCGPEPLRELWSGAGLVETAVAPIEVPTRFAGFADLWEPFLAGQGPAPGYVAALSPDVRARLRETLREAVPTGPDGTIELEARAWAVRGRRPAAGPETAGPDLHLRTGPEPSPA
ncbi:class I SAM-dependent methyltransferase [Streptomyces sp. NBC_01373]|uniref:class I SAM-dependent methyltransferase n=1 Tax=Streptomyces sp. NBC_01373 TaxID=2903843 RepID=UPI00224F249A|nr:class I SAM-dependent methyltransferase [Streptomyces sp. NBC_01373]MCX4703412.1 class I SAM-dependent methyltransferase [Streptomyces sp. NBC_01373]